MQAHCWVASNLSLRPAQPTRQLSGSLPGPRQPPFGVGHEALSTGLCLPLAFRRVAFASWAVLFPLRAWAVLPKIVRLTGWGQTASGLPRSAPVEMRRGRVPPILRDLGAPACRDKRGMPLPDQVAGPGSWSVYRRGSHRLRRPFVTQPPRRFICIHPSRLSLARLAWMVQAFLGLHPSAFARHVTGALARVGNRPGHWSGQWLLANCHSSGATSCRTLLAEMLAA